jgi:SAM-dependent methyltransferase
MPDAHYDDPVLAALYDVQCGWSEDRDFYLALAGTPPQDVLDLGCGTGLLCNAYAAEGHRVTGLDPSPGMLDVARRSPRGAEIEWILGTAETARPGKTFDLIIMTGHAFQVLLEDADIAGTLAFIREHLKPGGRAVFESRNPAIDWVKDWDGHTETIDLHGVPVGYSVHVLDRTADRMTFEQRYAFPDRTLPSLSTLRFASRAEIEALIAAAGLVADPLQGDWQGGLFDPEISEEMIFTVRIS